jgi:fatty acid desaturase
MLFFVWFFRPLTLNPWIRRYWHNYHHQHSGKVIDIEERGVTNGEKWSFIRLLITPDLVLGFLVRFRRLRREIMDEHVNGTFSDKDLSKLRQTVLFGLFPFGIPLTFLFYVWILMNGLIYFNLLDFSENSSFQLFNSVVSPIMFVFVIPNFIRQFCLHFITSNMHYYGDIEDGNIVQQTQVLNVWWTWPFQLFCFNFGATHSIHHFIVNETFYNRQLIMRKAHAILKNGGVPFNDIQSFKRNNNFNAKATN